MGTEQILVVGAGLAGATIAHELAVHGFNVTVIDQRDHVGGNTYDYVNEHGILVHKYGAHIFHTNNDSIFKWLSKFTDWIEYQHKVVAQLPDDRLIPFPPTRSFVNEMTIDYVKSVLYEPYTKKMWGLGIEDIDSSVINRVPVREDDGELYFPTDDHQYLPKYGYHSMVNKILTHENITVKLNTSFDKSMESDYFHVFNSMPIDVYYDYQYGELPYRSIKFQHAHHEQEKMSNHPVINFTDSGPVTRTIEWKNFPNHGANDKYTTMTHEIPCDYKDNHMERYYPVKDAKGVNRETYKKYKEIPNDKVTFIGRCGMYVYIDMDQAVSSSLHIAHKFINSLTIN
jgi:UDP-galactopyranose mutase